MFNKISTFFTDWIFPGYYLRNLLFHNYNKIKLPMFKCYEYIDISERLKYTIFELIKEFIEKEEPEKHICWYRTKEGEDAGHKYGEGNRKGLFPSLEGKYIMDIIKDIYNFYTKVLPELEYERDYLLEIWSKYIYNIHFEEDEDLKDVLKVVTEPTNYTLEDLEKENLNWNIILKYIEKKENFFNENLIHEEYKKLDEFINHQIQYYLHVAIEIREYLWT